MSAAARVLMFSGELAGQREIDSCWETLAVSAVVRPSSGVTSLTSRAPPGGVETWSGCVGAGMRGSAGTGGAAGNTNRYAQRMTQSTMNLRHPYANSTSWLPRGITGAVRPPSGGRWR